MLLTTDSGFVNPRRGWATLTSFALQTAGLAAILVIPLLQPSLLPQLSLTPPLVPLFAPSHFVPVTAQPSSGSSLPTHTAVLMAPSSVPPTISTDADPAPSGPEEPPCISCVVRDGGGGPIVPGGLGNIALAAVLPPLSASRPLRVSRMMDGLLIYRVQPEYPAMAKQIHLQGTVAIAAVISKEGTIENLHVLSGPPMLISSAMNAVKQWRYRPYVLNGDPIEVETQITVNFSLGGN